jgi:hypothetical protein
VGQAVTILLTIAAMLGIGYLVVQRWGIYGAALYYSFAGVVLLKLFFS